MKSFLPPGPVRAGAAVAMASMALLGACATTPSEPKLALQAAELAIATADRSRATDAASPELSEARGRLTAAREAVQAKRMVVAERLANESRVDAELASARIEAGRELAVNEEIQHGNVVLEEEMHRHQGAQQ